VNVDINFIRDNAILLLAKGDVSGNEHNDYADEQNDFLHTRFFDVNLVPGQKRPG
jgi:hypothetical protein